MRIKTIIEIAKNLAMNIDNLEIERLSNGKDGYLILDGEKTYTIEFVLTETEFMSASSSPDGVDKKYMAGKIENIHDSKEIYDLLTFIVTYKLI